MSEHYYFFLLEIKPEMPETKPTIKEIPAKIRTMKAESLPSKPSAVKAYRNTRVSIIQKMPKRIFVLLSIFIISLLNSL